MLIKTYTADSVAAALKKVRREMGGEAAVLRTRQVKAGRGGHRIEITACIEKPPVAEAIATRFETPEPAETDVSTPTRMSNSAVPSFDEEPAGNLADRMEAIERKLDRLLSPGLPVRPDQGRFGPLEHVYQRLKDADFPDAFLDPFMAALLSEYAGQGDLVTFAQEKLVKELSSMILPTLSFKPGDKVLFVGPAGAGKSSVMGKLATRLVTRQKQKVTLASLDYQKMAAHEELASYAEILQVKVTDLFGNMAEDNEDGNAITLIDAPALPTDSEKLNKLKERVEQISPNYRLAVFSALTRSGDMVELAKRIKLLAPTHAVVTMLDLTTCHGSMVAAAQALGVKITYVTNSSGGVGEVKTPNPEALAGALLRTEVSFE